MSENRIQGAIKKASGAVKEATGKATNNPKLQAKGFAEKTAGSIQNKVGKVEDATRR